MAGNNGNRAAGHFGRQMKKERLAHGWSLREFAARSGIDFATASRIENGKRPPNEKVARACDRVFAERRGWLLEYYEESKSWVPAGVRSWAEYEDKATILRAWSPGVLHGFLQTGDYARALLETSGAGDEVVSARLRSRMERQRRVLFRDDQPLSLFVVDELSLYRCVGSPEIMAEQCTHLASGARRPNVTMQVLSAVAHPAGARGFIVTDNAAYAEHVAGGFTYTDEETFTVFAEPAEARN
jgi:transcriptional regulator with XRE-family HTH domain